MTRPGLIGSSVHKLQHFHKWTQLRHESHITLGQCQLWPRRHLHRLVKLAGTSQHSWMSVRSCAVNAVQHNRAQLTWAPGRAEVQKQQQHEENNLLVDSLTLDVDCLDSSKHFSSCFQRL